MGSRIPCYTAPRFKDEGMSEAAHFAPPASPLPLLGEAGAVASGEEALLDSLQQALSAPDREDAASRFASDLEAFLADKPGPVLKNLAERLSLVGGPTPTIPDLRSILESEGPLTPDRAWQIIEMLAHALHADRNERLTVAWHLEREHSDHVNRRVLLKRRIALLEKRLVALEQVAHTDTTLPAQVIDIDPDEEAVLTRQAEAAAKAVHEAYEARMERDAARAGAQVLQVELKRSWSEVERLMTELGQSQEETSEAVRACQKENGKVQAAVVTISVLTEERDRLIAHAHAQGARIAELEVYRERLEQLRSLPPLRLLRSLRNLFTGKA